MKSRHGHVDAACALGFLRRPARLRVDLSRRPGIRWRATHVRGAAAFAAVCAAVTILAPGRAFAQGERAPRPRVLIVTDGTVSGAGRENADTVRSMVQGTVEEVLNELGFRLIDRTQLENVRDVDLAVNSGDAQRAQMLQRRFGCDIIAFGRWTRTFMDRRTNFGRESEFYRSDFRLRAVRADTAVIVYSGGSESPRESTTRQLQDLVRGTTRAAADRIVAAWSEQAFGAVEIELLVTGEDHRQIARLIDIVRSWPAVESISEREFIGNTGHYEIYYRGEAAELRRRCEDLTDPRCTVTRFAATRIEIALHTGRYELIVTGPDADLIAQFANAARGFGGMQSVDPREEGGTRAVFDIRWMGDEATFRGACDGLASPRAVVTSYTTARIEVTLERVEWELVVRGRSMDQVATFAASVAAWPGTSALSPIEVTGSVGRYTIRWTGGETAFRELCSYETSPRAEVVRYGGGTIEVVLGPNLFGTAVTSERLVIVLDVSGSMHAKDPSGGGEGPSSHCPECNESHAGVELPEERRRIVRAREALVRLVQDLPPTTRFAIVTYASDVSHWQGGRAIVPADEAAKQAAIAYVQALQPTSTTNTRQALEEAFGYQDADTIYLISDGMPTTGNRGLTPDELEDLYRRMVELNGGRGVRIHTLGFRGAPPDMMERLARDSGGEYREIP